MFWDANDPECSQNSLHNALVEIDCNRVLKVGDIVEVQRAISLPNQSVRLTAVQDENGNDDLEFEVEGASENESQQVLHLDDESLYFSKEHTDWKVVVNGKYV